MVAYQEVHRDHLPLSRRQVYGAPEVVVAHVQVPVIIDRRVIRESNPCGLCGKGVLYTMPMKGLRLSVPSLQQLGLGKPMGLTEPYGLHDLGLTRHTR